MLVTDVETAIARASDAVEPQWVAMVAIAQAFNLPLDILTAFFWGLDGGNLVERSDAAGAIVSMLETADG
jgi:hypothetical protein